MVITLNQILVFALILARIIGVISFAPFFSNRTLLSSGKMALILWLTILIVFVVPLPLELPKGNTVFIIAIVMELLIGALIGFATDLLVSGIEFAGSLMDTQAGLSVSAVLDPSTGKNAALFERFLRRTAILIFLIVDGHHMVLSAVYQSFRVLPVGAPVHIAQGSYFVLGLGKEIFAIALQLASPIILVIFLVDFSFGMLNRVAEQINVFQLGFQIKPIVSLFIFLAISPGLVQSILMIIETVLTNVVGLLNTMQ
jgi:flagellar biosynthetic protein FliR